MHLAADVSLVCSNFLKVRLSGWRAGEALSGKFSVHGGSVEKSLLLIARRVPYSLQW